MKCFIGISLVVLASLVLSTPAINHDAHGHHLSAALGQAPQYERIHVTEQDVEVEVKVANVTQPEVVPPAAQNVSAPDQNVTRVASLYPSSPSEGVPYDVGAPSNGSDKVGTYEKVHENCSHCLKENNVSTTKEVGCMCALFAAKYPTENEIPLLSTTFHNVSCHESVPSQQACDNICLASANSDLEDNIICSRVQHASNLTVYLQSKICENGTTWNYTGLSSGLPICCHSGLVIQC